MAIPSAEQAENDVEAYGAVHQPEVKAASNSLRISRTTFVAVSITIAMVGIVALLANSKGNAEDAIEDFSMTPNEKLNKLMVKMVKHGSTMTLEQMEKQLDAWRNDPSTLLDLPEHTKTQSLVAMASNTYSLATDSTLCAKKDIIIGKFKQLLTKLKAEEIALNTTHEAVVTEYSQALKAWLDSESDYRLLEQKAKDAEDGAKYARQQYEKYNTALKEATKAKTTLSSNNAAERQELQAEQTLIEEIMRLIGVLEATPASQSARPQSLLMNSAKALDPLMKLQAISSRLKQPKFADFLGNLKTQLSQKRSSSLEQYTESSEVATILRQMLQDITARLAALTTIETQAAKQETEMSAQLVDWQQKLVNLENAKEKAHAEANSEALEREKLAGKKKVAQQDADDETSEYKITFPPHAREIYVINVIIKKVEDTCK